MEVVKQTNVEVHLTDVDIRTAVAAAVQAKAGIPITPANVELTVDSGNVRAVVRATAKITSRTGNRGRPPGSKAPALPVGPVEAAPLQIHNGTGD